MNCTNCKVEIPVERLKALPDTTTCVNCSTVQPYRAVVTVSAKHKIVEVTPEPADSDVFNYIDDHPSTEE